MRTLISLFALVTLVESVSAATLTLHCEGVTRGADIVDSPSSKVIELDTVSKRILRVAPNPTACFIGKLQSKKTHLYEDTTDFTCLSDIAESYLKVSRYTYKIEEVTRFIGKDGEKDNFWIGNFSCSEKKRKF